jgi:hypothetical protein
MSPTIVADGNADGKASADRIFVEDEGGHEDLPTEIAVPNEEWENLLQQDKKSGEESKKKGKTWSKTESIRTRAMMESLGSLGSNSTNLPDDQ